MSHFRQDFRFAFRMLSRNKALSLSAILTLALGIGASTSIFSVIHGVLLLPLPYSDPDRVVQVWQMHPRTGNHMQTSDPNFEEWRDRNRSLQAIAQYNSGVTSVTGGSEPVRTRTAWASDAFFDILAVAPAFGRRFSEEELKENGRPAVIVSHGFWQRLLGGTTDLSSKTLRFNNNVFNVVGVMPQGFDFPSGTEIWFPRELLPRNPHRTGHNWRVIARLEDGVPLEAAREDMHSIGRWQAETYAGDIWLRDVALVPLREELTGDVRPQLMILMGAVGLLLLVACSDVANLLLAQSSGQRRELAVRSALGASRWRLAQLYLSQSLLMTLGGSLLGIAISAFGVPALLALEPGNLPRADEIGVHPPVLLFAIGTALLTALALALVPMLQLSPGRLNGALTEGGRWKSGGSNRVRAGLVIGQTALTVLLLAGAGLLGRSFLQILNVDPGFRTENLVVLQLNRARPADDEGRASLSRFNEELMQRLSAIPGVDQVGGINRLPLEGGYANGQFMVDNNREDTGIAEFRVASEGYFPALGIPLIRGRLPAASDTMESPHVAVISQSLAESKWPGEDALGKRIQFGNMDGDIRLLNVVGIVGDVLDYGLDSRHRSTIYLNARQRPQRAATFSIVMRTTSSAASLVNQARNIVNRMDPELPLRFRTLGEVYSSSLADRRFSLILLGIFGTAALALAAIGLFGVLAYLVSQRTAEIGVRMALGANRGNVIRLVLRQGLSWAMAGTILGILGALGLTRFLSGMLFATAPTDPVSLATAAGTLLAAALLACYLPALRASRLDPMRALRME